MNKHLPANVVEHEILVILTEVAENGEPCPKMGELGEQIGTSLPNLQKRIRALIDRGLLKREMKNGNVQRFLIVSTGKWTDWTARRTEYRKQDTEMYWERLLGERVVRFKPPPIPEWVSKPLYENVGAWLLGDPPLNRPTERKIESYEHYVNDVGVSLPWLKCLYGERKVRVGEK